MYYHRINKHILHILAVLLVLTLLLGTVPAVYADGESGACGDQLSWSLSAGTLAITGSGAMTDFTEKDMAPWYGLRSQIVRLVMPEGLTAIGDLAFYGCENLTAVTVPASVTRIGAYAFAGCTEMTMLNLGSVRFVGESAFSDCVSLKALRLPDSLESIGLKGFYRCESINTVTIPASVTSLGISAFSYCKNLVNAEIQASVSTIPELLFYGCVKLSAVTIAGTANDIGDFAFRGCDALTTVYHDGSTMDTEEIREMVSADIPAFEGTGHVSEGTVSNTVTSGSATTNDDGTVTQENITATQNHNSSVSIRQETTRSEETSEESYRMDITVTVEDEAGWQEAQDAVEDALKTYNDTVAAGKGEAETPNVNVYVKDTDIIEPEFVENLAGRDVNVTITTQNGSVWKINGNNLDKQSDSPAYTLSYTLGAGSQELCQELETMTSFVLKFSASAQVNAELLIRLGDTWARQTATLFQRNGRELTRYQTVVVDGEGYAHFYLASVRDDADYYIAMNLPEQQEEAIIPDELLHEYGQPVNYTPIQYEITGRESSWGMNINQVTWIMIGGMTAVVVTVGFVMYLLNKRKLRMGYVPDLDEEFE